MSIKLKHTVPESSVTGIQKSPHRQACKQPAKSVQSGQRFLKADSYVVSTLVHWITGQCDLLALRSLNLVALGFIFLVVLSIRGQLSTRSGEPSYSSTSISHVHTAFNICLFPPLFFFSALYYTDVLSTLSVLVSYRLFLSTTQEPRASLLSKALVVLVAVLALLFRQTNVFWVSVFPAGLSVVQELKSLPSRTKTRVEVGGKTILKASHNVTLDDKKVSEAYLEGECPILLQ